MVEPTAELVTLEGKRPLARDWPNQAVSKTEAEAHLKGGGSLGLKTRHHPVIDVDVEDPQLAELVCTLVQQQLGPAPRRTRSNSSKTALVYATSEPMRKQKLVIEGVGAVEVLGDGQQAMILGTHPSGVPVEWDRNPIKSDLTAVTSEAIEAALAAVTMALKAEGHAVRRSGTNQAAAPAQEELLAPSSEQALDALRALDVNAYESRDEWLQVLAATKASVEPADWPVALEAVQEWASEWEGGNDPDYVEATWKSLRAPFRLGWPFLSDHAGIIPFEVEPAAPSSEHKQGKLWTLAELLANPDMLKLPEPISPLFAYEGRLTVLSGREKLAGKSTLATWDAATASHRHTVLWITYEESLADIVRRFATFNAEPEQTLILERPSAPEITKAITEHGCALVYIDSFAAYVGAVYGKAPATHESETWQQLTLQLKDLAHRTGAAVITLAHTSKSDDEGGIRGSTGIAAAADLIARIATPRRSDPDNLRRISFIGRWTIEPVQVRLEEDGFLVDGEAGWPVELALEPAIYCFVRDEETPPTLRVIRDRVKGKNKEIDLALAELIRSGLIHRENKGRGFAHYAEPGFVPSPDGTELQRIEDVNGDLVGEDSDE